MHCTNSEMDVDTNECDIDTNKCDIDTNKRDIENIIIPYNGEFIFFVCVTSHSSLISFQSRMLITCTNYLKKSKVG